MGSTPILLAQNNKIMTFTNKLPGLKSCGKGCFFYGTPLIVAPQKLSIGDNVHINSGATIDAQGGVSIGNNTHIARNLTIFSYSHNYKGDALPYDNTKIRKPVVIGKNVWIGMCVMIIPGITIGEGAVIGMGTVVSRDIPPLAIVGSQPPRIIKYRDKDHYDDLEERGIYSGKGGQLLK